jgi:hypothetical protein
MKYCYKCKQFLSEEKFSKDRGQKDGFCRRCKKCTLAFQRGYDKYPKRKFCIYKKGAKKRKKEFALSFEEFNELWQKPCYYCGEKIEFIGIDRFNNNKGYIAGNIVPCCWKCNSLKGAWDGIQYIEQCEKVAKHLGDAHECLP